MGRGDTPDRTDSRRRLITHRLLLRLRKPQEWNGRRLCGWLAGLLESVEAEKYLCFGHFYNHFFGSWFAIYSITSFHVTASGFSSLSCCEIDWMMRTFMRIFYRRIFSHHISRCSISAHTTFYVNPITTLLLYSDSTVILEVVYLVTPQKNIHC